MKERDVDTKSNMKQDSHVSSTYSARSVRGKSAAGGGRAAHK